MSKMDEQIIVVPRRAIFGPEDSVVFQGLLKKGEDLTPKFREQHDWAADGVTDGWYTLENYLERIQDFTEVMRRGDAEENFEFKQPIPYIMLTKEVAGEKYVFAYKRLEGGGEARLHGKVSIGVGGHMNVFGELADVLEEAKREIHEEVEFLGGTVDEAIVSMDYVGLINDDVNDVGKVHIGILIEAHISRDAIVQVREKDQLDGDWFPVKTIANSPELVERLENWSKFAIQALA